LLTPCGSGATKTKPDYERIEVVIDMTAVNLYAERIMAMIWEDMERPSSHGKQIPRDIASFAALHDYVDANDYLSQAGVPWGTDPGAGDDGSEMVDAVCTEVSCRLEAGELRCRESSSEAGPSR
jgi:hypothetical protein